VTPRLHTPANFLHLPEELPEIFDIFFDAVVGLGVLVGEYHGPEEVPEILDIFFDAVVGLGVLVGEYLGQTVLALRACMRARLNNW